MSELYVSSANEKHKKYYEWADKHPIKHIEQSFNTKLTIIQKIKLLYVHWIEKRKKKAFNKLLSKYIKK